MEEVPGTPESELFCSCQMASLSFFFSFPFFFKFFTSLVLEPSQKDRGQDLIRIRLRMQRAASIAWAILSAAPPPGPPSSQG